MANLTSDDIFQSDLTSAEAAIEAFILSCICLVAVVANVSLWLVIIRTRDLRTESNMLILCLSLADLLVSAVSMPITVATIIASQWQFSSTTCTAMGYINMLAFVTSVESLGVISINRYVKICRPALFVSVYSYRNVFFMCLGVWMVSGTLSVPPLVGWAVYAYLPYASICFCNWSVSLSYAIFMIGVCFCLPCFIMLLCYISILKTFFQSRRAIQAFSEPSQIAAVSADGISRKGQEFDTALTKSQSVRRENDCRSKKSSNLICVAGCSLCNDIKQPNILFGIEDDTTYESCGRKKMKLTKSKSSSDGRSNSTVSRVSTSGATHNVVNGSSTVSNMDYQTRSNVTALSKNLTCSWPRIDHEVQLSYADKDTLCHSIALASGINEQTDFEKCELEDNETKINVIRGLTNCDVETKDVFYSDKDIKQQSLTAESLGDPNVKCCNEEDARATALEYHCCNQNEKNDITSCPFRHGNYCRNIQPACMCSTDETIDQDLERVDGNILQALDQHSNKCNSICKKARVTWEKDIGFQKSQDCNRRKITMDTSLCQKQLANHKMTGTVIEDNELVCNPLTSPTKFCDVGIYSCQCGPCVDQLYVKKNALQNCSVSESLCKFSRPETDKNERRNESGQNWSVVNSLPQLDKFRKKPSKGKKSDEFCGLDVGSVKNMDNCSISRLSSLKNNSSQNIHDSEKPVCLAKRHDVVLSSTRDSPVLCFQDEADLFICDKQPNEQLETNRKNSHSAPSATQNLTNVAKMSAGEPLHENHQSELNTLKCEYAEASQTLLATRQKSVKDNFSSPRDWFVPGLVPIKPQDNSAADNVFPSSLPAVHVDMGHYLKEPEEAVIAEPCKTLSDCQARDGHDTTKLSLSLTCTQFRPDSGPSVTSANQNDKNGGRKIDKRKFWLGFPLLFYYEHLAASQLDTIHEEENNDAFPAFETNHTHTTLEPSCPRWTDMQENKYDSKINADQNIDEVNTRFSDNGLMKKQKFNQDSNQESKKNGHVLHRESAFLTKTSPSFAGQYHPKTMPSKELVCLSEPDCVPERKRNDKSTVSSHKTILHPKQLKRRFQSSCIHLFNKKIKINGVRKSKVHPIKKVSTKGNFTNSKHIKEHKICVEGVITPSINEKQSILDQGHPDCRNCVSPDEDVTASNACCVSNISKSSEESGYGTVNLSGSFQTSTCDLSKDNTSIFLFQSQPSTSTANEIFSPYIPDILQTQSVVNSQNSDILHNQPIGSQNFQPDICDCSSNTTTDLTLSHSHQCKIPPSPSSQSQAGQSKHSESICAGPHDRKSSSDPHTNPTSSPFYKKGFPQHSLTPLSSSTVLPSALKSQKADMKLEFAEESSTLDESCRSSSSLQVRTASKSSQRRSSTQKQFSGSNLLAPPEPKLKNRMSNLSDRRKKEEYQLTASLLVVIVIFIICWFPYCISMFVSIFSPHLSSRGLDTTSLLLGYLNSCVNPIVYGLMNKRFRSAYKKLFSCDSLVIKRPGKCCLNWNVLCNKPKTSVSIVVSSS